MSTQRLRRIPALAVLWLLGLLWLAGAQAQVAVPPLKSRVTDLTNTLSQEQRAALDRKLGVFETRKGSQIAVLLLPTTKPETIEQYSIRVAEQWKIGRGRIDDGVIVVVAKDDRTLRIEVGYGLEGALPDAAARRIIDEVIVPRFRAGDFAGGIDAGVDRIMRVIDGEPLPPPPAPRGVSFSGDAETFQNLFALGFVIIFFFSGLLRLILGRLLGAAAMGAIGGGIAWFLSGSLVFAIIGGLVVGIISMFSDLIGAMGGGGSSRGGGWSGGSSGGSWGGGGGGFGGGGASGRW